jgi:hypothetical protein
MRKNIVRRLPKVNLRSIMGDESNKQLRNHEGSGEDKRGEIFGQVDKLSITTVTEHLHRKKQFGRAGDKGFLLLLQI